MFVYFLSPAFDCIRTFDTGRGVGIKAGTSGTFTEARCTATPHGTV